MIYFPLNPVGRTAGRLLARKKGGRTSQYEKYR